MNTSGVQACSPDYAFQRDAVPEHYRSVREMTRRFCAPLTADDQMVQSATETSPVKWHQAHTTWFFETFLLSAHLPGYQPFSPAFRSLFNSYYKQVGTHPLRTVRSTFSRPSLPEVQAYRDYVDRHMMKLLSTAGETAELGSLVLLGIHHEQQHQELILTDIKHAFWTNPLRPEYRRSAAGVDLPARPQSPVGWHEFPGGLCEVGHAGEGFAFDNEGPRHQTYSHPFRLASRLVTNGEYREFMADNGYRRPELWLSDGWDAVLANGWEAPLYWEREGDGWTYFTLSGMNSVELREPVCHVSYYEADAFARWAGCRLATEIEWEVAAQALPLRGNLLEQGGFHPAPAPEIRRPSETGPQQMYGDVWEWTQSPYTSYPGFVPASGALGEYNGKFMCNQIVLRGGSFATSQSHIRATYRNFFPPASRWQFMGIRLAK